MCSVQLSDRIMVMCGGKVSGIVDPRKVTKEDIGLMMIHAEGAQASGGNAGDKGQGGDSMERAYTYSTGKRASSENGQERCGIQPEILGDPRGGISPLACDRAGS